MSFKERYKYDPVKDLLGTGGFARVYKATDMLLEREVALKVFDSGSVNKNDLVAEIKRAIKLEHYNLCRYYDVAILDYTTAFGDIHEQQIGVMEYLDGGDLKTFIKLHPQQLNKLLTDVLSGLSFLHEEGIIHRDLKAQNILIKNTTKGPIAKITDFGISKAVNNEQSNSSSVLIGTVESMAPEQFNPAKYGINGRIGVNVDLWSFGVMLYELVTGQSLFGNRLSGTSAEQVMSNILDDTIEEGRINAIAEPYKTLIRVCIVKNADGRVQNADTLINMLHDEKSVKGSINLSEQTVVVSKPQVKNEANALSIPQHKTDFSKDTAQKTINKNPGKKNKRWIMYASLLVVLLAATVTWWKLKPAYFNGPAVASKLFPIMDAATTKWGFTDSITGKLVVPYQFDWADSMFDGVARVNLNKKFGIINNTGKVAGEIKYDLVKRSTEEFSAVLLDFKWGFINRNGTEIIPVKYKSNYSPFFSEGIVALSENNKLGFFDTSGKQIIAFKYEPGSHYNSFFKDGIAIVSLNKKWGCIDKAGTEVVPLNYDLISDFREGMAAVRRDSKDGFIDKTGNEIIPPKYDHAYSFFDGLAAVDLDGKYGFIDKSGAFIIPFKKNVYYHLFFSEGLTAVSVDSKLGFIDKSGKQVIPPKYQYAGDFKNGLARVKLDGKIGFIDKAGNEVTAIKYEYDLYRYPYNDFDEGLADIKLNGKPGFVDISGKETILSKYDAVSSFVEGFANIRLSEKCGTIDKNFREVIKPTYDYFFTFHQGLARVKLNGNLGLIDYSGKQLTEFTPFYATPDDW